MYFKLVCAFLFFIPFLLQAQTDEVGEKKRKFFGFSPLSDTITKESKGVFLLPLLYYTPDTRWAAGAAGVCYFKRQPKTEGQIETRMSNVQFLADYTQNRQLDISSNWNIFTANENYLIKGDIRFRNFPDKFYGIGNQTSLSQVEKYSYDLLVLRSLQLKKIKPGLFLGFDYEFEYEFNFQLEPSGDLENGSVLGNRGSIGSAIGLVGVLDTRDNVINAYKGRLAELSTYFFLPQLGSTFRFIVVNGSYQHYWRLKSKHILAWQTKTRFTFGDVSFLDLPTLGNDDILRGYAKNRFRDKYFMGTQFEYRFPLIWRFGGVAFAGAGDVFGPSSNLSFKNLKYSIGAGLRFVVNPAERLNIRLDYGYGKEGGHFYFVVAESF